MPPTPAPTIADMVTALDTTLTTLADLARVDRVVIDGHLEELLTAARSAVTELRDRAQANLDHVADRAPDLDGTRLLTRAEAAAAAGVHIRTIDHWRTTGQLTRHRSSDGNHLTTRFLRSDVMAVARANAAGR